MSDVDSNCALQVLDFRLGESVLKSEKWFSNSPCAPTVAERGKVQRKTRLPFFKLNTRHVAHPVQPFNKELMMLPLSKS